jgi:hypothetical protein
MRKRLITPIPQDDLAPDAGGLDLDGAAVVEEFQVKNWSLRPTSVEERLAPGSSVCAWLDFRNQG